MAVALAMRPAPLHLSCMEFTDEKLLERSINFFSVFHRRNGKHFNWMVNCSGQLLIALAGLTPFLMEHLVEAGTRKKRPTSWVFFFLPAFGRYCAFGAARLRRAAPPAPPPPNWIALAHRPTSHSRLDRRCAYPRIALIRQTIWALYPTGSGKGLLTHFG